MAKGTDSNEFVVLSRVRTGLKREFAFAMKAQSEICGGSLGRTRGSKNRNEVPVRTAPATKRSRKSGSFEEKKNSEDVMSEEEEKSDVVDLASDDEPKNHVGESTAMPICGEEPKNDVVETVINEEPSKEEVMDAMAQPLCEGKEDLEVTEAKEEKGTNEVTPVSVNDEGKIEKPQRRFTRSALRQESEETKIVDDVSALGDGIGDIVVRETEASQAVESTAMPVCEEGPKSDSVETLLNEEPHKAESLKEKVREDLHGLEKCAPEDKVTPVSVIDRDEGKKVPLEKPLRRFTRSALKQISEETKIVDDVSAAGVGIDDSGEMKTEDSHLITTPTPMKMPKTFRKKFPSKLKDLLATGILEGLPVTYLRSSKTRREETGEKGLHGVIRGSGVLCYCEDCKGVEVVTPSVFELHAGSANKRPPEYIYLENDSTLRDVMNACWNIPLHNLEEAIQKILGDFTMKKSSICLNCRVPISEAGKGLSRLACDSCMELKDSQPNPPPASVASRKRVSPPVQPRSPEHVVVPKSLNTGMKHSEPVVVTNSLNTGMDHSAPVVVPKSLNTGMKHSASRGKSRGKITRKDLRLHKLVFEEDVLKDGTELAYYANGKKLLIGYKMGYGIYCTCCDSEVSASQFEAHAGWASRRKPYLHIYTSDGVSLHDLSISLSRDRKFSTSDNDDLCSICEDGGDLLCCDGCPRAFHIDCVPLPGVPSDAWYCKYCRNHFQNDRQGERNVSARSVRVVKNVEGSHGGCAFCRSHNFSKSFGPRTVIICDQCEKEYHVGCLKDHNMQNLEKLPEGKWFCTTNCNQIHSALTNLVSCGEMNLPESLQSLIKKKLEEKNLDTGADLDIKWRVLNWRLDSSVETRKPLSKAVSIFHERFNPIVDSASGRDYIPTMLYGRHIRSLDFGGMYCAVLTVNQVVVSAGIFRVFGSEVAELPLVATVADCQGQGYFQCLFSCIENLLVSLNVRNIVLPSAEETESIWTSKFGFAKLGLDEINHYKRFYRMMIFQGTSLLQKPVSAL